MTRWVVKVGEQYVDEEEFLLVGELYNAAGQKLKSILITEDNAKIFRNKDHANFVAAAYNGTVCEITL